MKYKNVTCTCTIGCLRQYFCKTLHNKYILNTQPLDKITRHKHQSGGYNQQVDIEMVTIIKVLLNEGHKVSIGEDFALTLSPDLEIQFIIIVPPLTKKQNVFIIADGQEENNAVQILTRNIHEHSSTMTFDIVT